LDPVVAVDDTVMMAVMVVEVIVTTVIAPEPDEKSAGPRRAIDRRNSAPSLLGCQ
jgi:hypothetical protein